MKLTLRNEELVPAINLLDKMELKPYESRQRTKLLKLLEKAAAELGEEQAALLKECAVLNDSGEPKLYEGGTYTLLKDKVQWYHTESKKLLDEEVIIEGGTYSQNIKTFKGILESYDGTLSGEDAKIYDRLLDEYEKGEEQ